MKRRIVSKKNVEKLMCNLRGEFDENPPSYGEREWLECYFNEKTDTPYSSRSFNKVILNDVKTEEHTLRGFEATFNSPKTCEYDILPEEAPFLIFEELRCYR